MNKILFEGAATALVTPFRDGKPDLPMLRRLLERQVDAGIRAVVISGTTGESPTLSDEEKQLIFREAKQILKGRALMIAGTGSNSTEHAVSLSRMAQLAGADALLVVTPYYNKASPQGLVEHFQAVARAVTIPVILYNVPSRTGVDLPVSVCRTLSRIPNIAGIKEASPDLRKAAHLRAACPDTFGIWSGNDDLTLPMISLGASGVISVASNLVPALMEQMTQAALHSDFTAAGALAHRMLPLWDALFSEVNPIPVKAAMGIIGLDCGSCRLPLTDASSETLEAIRRSLMTVNGPET